MPTLCKHAENRHACTRCRDDEIERLRGLLREAKPVTVELVALLQATSKHLPASAPIDMSAAQAAMDDLTGWISRIDAALAGAAVQPIAVTGNCGLCGQPRADHAEVAPDGKPECRMKENSHHG